MKIILLACMIVVIASCGSPKKPVAGNDSKKQASQSTATYRVIGTQRDIVQFYLNGQLIGTENGLRPERQIDIPHSNSGGNFDQYWANDKWNGCSFRPCTTMDVKSATVDGTYYFSIRHGDLRDLVFYYAVVGGRIFRSAEWSDSGPGNTEHGVAVDHRAHMLEIRGFPFSEGDGRTGVPNGGSSFGHITFDPAHQKFTYEKDPSSSFADTAGPKGEMFLPVN
jgi:hypothetical protein